MKRFTRLLPRQQLDGMPYTWEDELSLVNGKGGGDQTTTQSAEPWSQQAPYLEDLYRQAQAQFNKPRDTYSNINPVAGFSQQTLDGLDALDSNNYASRNIRNTVQQGLRTTGSSDGGNAYAQFVQGSGGRQLGTSIDPGTSSQLVDTGVQQAQANTGDNYLIPTAEVNAADRLSGILAGGEDQALQDYMASSSKLISDELIRNQLLPAQMDQLISGGYGGSSTQNVRRGAATDIADAIGRNNNSLILQQQDRQLDAANIVTGAQRDASNYGIDVFNSGVDAAGVAASDAASRRSASTARDNIGLNRERMSLDAMIAGDQLELDRARLGGSLAPIYDELQYSDARRDLQAGSVYEAREQAARDAAIAKEMYNKGTDQQALQDYANIIYGSGNPGGTSTTVTPSGGSGGFAGALGGASTGAGIAGALSLTGPVGWGITGIGALLGGLG